MRTRLRSRLLPAALLTATLPALAMEYQTTEAAKSALFPNATFSSHDFTLSPGQVNYLKTQLELPVMHSQVRVSQVSTGGWLYLDQVYGLRDVVTYLVALDEEGVVRGIEILECEEGFCEVGLRTWRAQFIGKTLQEDASPMDGISNISGTTLSVWHIAEGVKKVLAIHEYFLPAAR